MTTAGILAALRAVQWAKEDAARRRVTPRPLLVGELNPYGGDPDKALFPYPERASGDRLCRLVLGLDPVTYLRRFDRTNLCTAEFLRISRRELFSPTARSSWLVDLIGPIERLR